MEAPRTHRRQQRPLDNQEIRLVLATVAVVVRIIPGRLFGLCVVHVLPMVGILRLLPLRQLGLQGKLLASVRRQLLRVTREEGRNDGELLLQLHSLSPVCPSVHVLLIMEAKRDNLDRSHADGHLGVHHVLCADDARLENLGHVIQVGKGVAHIAQVLVKRAQLAGGVHGNAVSTVLFDEGGNGERGGVLELIAGIELLQPLHHVRNEVNNVLLFVCLHLQLIRLLQSHFLLDVEFRVPIDEPLLRIRNGALLGRGEVIVDRQRVNHHRCVHVSDLVLAGTVLRVNRNTLRITVEVAKVILLTARSALHPLSALVLSLQTMEFICPVDFQIGKNRADFRRNEPNGYWLA